VTLLTPSERLILERIRDNGPATGISGAWAIEKGWAVRSRATVKLTAAGIRMLESDEAGQASPVAQSL